MNSDSSKSQPQIMPIAFLGHGSPENALNSNAWTKSLEQIGKKYPAPKNILIISAHWTTNQLKITSSPEPELIYDFFGFPRPLYSFKYPCQGSVEFAHHVAQLVNPFQSTTLDSTRGFDHGVWTCLCHLYPKGEIPVVQLSLNMKMTAKELIQLGETLKPLRKQGVFIIGSGNIVHNLRELNSITADPFEWAKKFDHYVKEALMTKNHNNLVEFSSEMKSIFEQSHPSPDHYWPLLICAGASNANDKVQFPFEGFQYGSISMRNVLWG